MLSFRLVQHAQRVSPFVVAPDTPGSEAFDADNRLEIRRTPNEPPGGRRAMTRLALAATREAYRRRPDVILSMHLRSGYCAPWLAKTPGVPFVQYIHARELVQRPRLARFLLQRAAATIAVSSYTAALALACGAPAERLHTIPPGVDLGRSRATARRAAHARNRGSARRRVQRTRRRTEGDATSPCGASRRPLDRRRRRLTPREAGTGSAGSRVDGGRRVPRVP